MSTEYIGEGSNSFLENVFSTILNIPGVRVNRTEFLQEQFCSDPALDAILEYGPIKANCSKQTLHGKASAIIIKSTAASTLASFAAGIPGGLAIGVTIPSDIIQFYVVAVRTAQQLAYLYGAEDLWLEDGIEDMAQSDKTMNELLLYLGVMLGSTTASEGVRVLSSQLAKELLKKNQFGLISPILDRLPFIAKPLFYKTAQSVAKKLGYNLSTQSFKRAAAKVVPILGGVISGGITFATMRPMGMRLLNILEEANFSYTPQDAEKDMQDIIRELNIDVREL